jgi:N6-adenosine-specific RNA methylase IME4
MKKYNAIYADPPWQYRDKAHAGKRGAEYKYPCLSIDDIKALPVNTLAAEDCALLLWVTFPQLQEGMDVMAAWGFKYKTVAFTWVKTTKNGKLFWGMGNWTRSNAEICLLGLRGRPSRISCGVHSIIMTPVREHSRKPDEARERIVQLMGDVPRIELFARERAPGWDAWGNEVESDLPWVAEQ